MTKQRIFVAGHRGMVGSAIVRQLEQRGDVEVIVRTRDELNLLDSKAVQDFFADSRIDQVYLAAAKVGGIVANNTYPADFIYENMMIESNIIHAAHLHNVNKLLFLGSSCIYPKSRTPLPRLPESNCASPITASTTAIIARSCRPTCMGRTIISTRAIRT